MEPLKHWVSIVAGGVYLHLSRGERKTAWKLESDKTTNESVNGLVLEIDDKIRLLQRQRADLLEFSSGKSKPDPSAI